MSDTCKCGHGKEAHNQQDRQCLGPVCKACACLGYCCAPVPAREADGWQSEPERIGWHWLSRTGEAASPWYVNSLGSLSEEPKGQWLFITNKSPAPPAPPLPTSRSVTLTAKLDAGGQVAVSAGGYMLERYVSPVRQHNIDRCRKHYGIEPEQAP